MIVMVDFDIKCPYCDCTTIIGMEGLSTDNTLDEVYCSSYKCGKPFFIEVKQKIDVDIFKLVKHNVCEGIINPDNLDFKL
jgi:hypothetical protein